MNSEAMAYLASKGLSLDDIIEFARISERKADPTNAERQARYRARRRNGVTVTDVIPPLDKEKSPKPPKEINPPLYPPIPDGMAPNPDEAEKPLSVDELVDEWNELATDLGLPTVAKLTDSRRRRAQARLKQYPELEAWQRAFACIRGSPWLQGSNDRGWRADFDFLLQDKSFTKLVEGSYGQN